MTTLSIAPAYRSAIWTAVALQFVLTIMLSSILDGGKIAVGGGCAMIAFWIGAMTIILRRQASPRRTDLLFIRWGFVPLMVMGIVLRAWFGFLRH